MTGHRGEKTLGPYYKDSGKLPSCHDRLRGRRDCGRSWLRRLRRSLSRAQPKLLEVLLERSELLHQLADLAGATSTVMMAVMNMAFGCLVLEIPLNFGVVLLCGRDIP